MDWIQVMTMLIPILGCLGLIIFQAGKIVKAVEVLQAAVTAINQRMDRFEERMNRFEERLGKMAIDILSKKKK